MYSIALASPMDVEGWRCAARRLRLAGAAPDTIAWRMGPAAPSLIPAQAPPDPPEGAQFTAPRAFLALAENVLLHRSEARFDLMYRLLWRLQDDHALLARITDPEVSTALAMQKAVFTAIHKMHAFVRFRRIDDDASQGGEAYAAWFEPRHYVVKKGIKYFVDRLANVRFTILTPDITAVWDRERLQFGPGADRAQAPGEDAAEEAWKTYFASIFNPARVNPKVMTQHMAKSYWRNLPEAPLIKEMISSADVRTRAMIAADASAPPLRAARLAARHMSGAASQKAAPRPYGPDALEDLNAAVQACRACSLWRDATQPVLGEGPSDAAVMLVGEQPGDEEDLRGRPFVGPAGQLLDAALAAAGIERQVCHLTNAVKHFAHERRGKRRLHRTPDAGAQHACRPWLDAELKIVRPKVVVALGATAGAALLGRPVSVLREAGPVGAVGVGAQGFLTVHPAFVLRQPGGPQREAAFQGLTRTLAMAWAATRN